MYHCLNKHLKFLTVHDIGNVFHFIIFQPPVFSVSFKLQKTCRDPTNLGCDIEVDLAFFKIHYCSQWQVFFSTWVLSLSFVLCIILETTSWQTWSSTAHSVCVCVCVSVFPFTLLLWKPATYNMCKNLLVLLHNVVMADSFNILQMQICFISKNSLPVMSMSLLNNFSVFV